MDNQVVYVVTEYGCNSTPNDMLVPVSKIFVNYEAAYAYFLKMSPCLDDKDNDMVDIVNVEMITKNDNNTFILL